MQICLINFNFFHAVINSEVSSLNQLSRFMMTLRSEALWAFGSLAVSCHSSIICLLVQIWMLHFHSLYPRHSFFFFNPYLRTFFPLIFRLKVRRKKDRERNIDARHIHVRYTHWLLPAGSLPQSGEQTFNSLVHGVML